MRPTAKLAVFLLPLTMAFTPSRADAQLRYPPMYPGYRYAAPESDLRVDVKPRDASVYVDGYFAGKVEDFNGVFQRLHVPAGEHDIVVYLEGYRSMRQRLYLSPNTTRKITGSLERLSPGEAPEPEPSPAAEPNAAGRPGRSGPDDPYATPPLRGARRVPPPPPDGPRNMPPDMPPDARREGPPNRQQSPASSTSGTLSIRVQPAGSTVLIDGEQWSGPSDDERLIVQVPQGRHVVEVRRNGYDRFTTEIDVQAGETAPVNISLTRAR